MATLGQEWSFLSWLYLHTWRGTQGGITLAANLTIRFSAKEGRQMPTVGHAPPRKMDSRTPQALWGMVVKPWVHKNNWGRLNLRVHLTGVDKGRGALWHDVLWYFFYNKEQVYAFTPR